MEQVKSWISEPLDRLDRSSKRFDSDAVMKLDQSCLTGTGLWRSSGRTSYSAPSTSIFSRSIASVARFLAMVDRRCVVTRVWVSFFLCAPCEASTCRLSEEQKKMLCVKQRRLSYSRNKGSDDPSASARHATKRSFLGRVLSESRRLAGPNKKSCLRPVRLLVPRRSFVSRSTLLIQ